MRPEGAEPLGEDEVSPEGEQGPRYLLKFGEMHLVVKDLVTGSRDSVAEIGNSLYPTKPDMFEYDARFGDELLLACNELERQWRDVDGRDPVNDARQARTKELAYLRSQHPRYRRGRRD